MRLIRLLVCPFALLLFGVVEAKVQNMAQKSLIPHEKRASPVAMCHYDPERSTRPGFGSLKFSEIEKYPCTHIVYGTYDTGRVEHWNIPESDLRIIKLLRKRYGIKFLMGVSVLKNDVDKMLRGVETVIAKARSYPLDGIELTQACDGCGVPKGDLAKLVQTFSEQLAKFQLNQKFLLTARVSDMPSRDIDDRVIRDNLDYIIIDSNKTLPEIELDGGQLDHSGATIAKLIPDMFLEVRGEPEMVASRGFSQVFGNTSSPLPSMSTILMFVAILLPYMLI